MIKDSIVYGFSLSVVGLLWLGEKAGWWPEQGFWPPLLMILGIASIAWGFHKRG